MKPHLSLRAVAEREGCSHSTVLSLVRSGHLRAIDISTGRGRAHYVVPVEWLEEFERERTTKPPAPKQKRRRRKLPAVTEYIL